MKLRCYQQEAVTRTIDLIKSVQCNPIIALPTGSGKALVCAGLVLELLKLKTRGKILMLTHKEKLIRQNFSKLLVMNPQVDAGINCAGIGRRENDAQVIYASIQSVVKKPEQFGVVSVVIIDECHLVSPNAETSYQKFLAALRAKNDQMRVIGLSATPYRMGLGYLTEGGIFDTFSYDKTGRDDFLWFIRQGYLSPLVARPEDSVEIDLSGVRKSGGEFVQSELAKATNLAHITEAALDSMCELGKNRKKWLIFGTGIDHCEAITQGLIDRGIKAAVLHSKLKEYDEVYRAFECGEIQALVNNDMLTTGYDAPDIDMIGILRATESPGLWCLSEDTRVLTPDGWKYHWQVEVGDNVYSYDMLTGSIKYDRAIGKVRRPLEESEFMINAFNQNVDFLVSNKHDVVCSTRNGQSRARTKYRKESAERLLELPDFHIPVSGHLNSDGVPELSLFACELLGLWLSDGSFDKSRNSLDIYQSGRYPKIQNRIEYLLKKLNMPINRQVISGDICFGKPRLHDMTCYRVSRGPSRKFKGKQGWGFLGKFLEKDFSLLLFNLSRLQFKALLWGIHLGDGAKGGYGQYPRRTYQISTGNEKYAERLSACATLNGFAAKIVTKPAGKTRLSPLYLVYIKEQTYRNVKKDDVTRSGAVSSVWCLETLLGTLITERKGKINITGNCQILGRGTRVVYQNGFDLSNKAGRLASINAGPKQNCLVLDFPRNTERLGPINNLRIPTKPKRGRKQKKRRPAVKTCGECGVYVAATVRKCPECGYKFPTKTKIKTTPGCADIIDNGEGKVDIQRFKVDSVVYMTHRKKGRPDSLKAIYKCGIQPFTLYLAFDSEYPGLKRKAQEWWKHHERDGDYVPMSTAEALKHSITLQKPTFIEMDLGPKYAKLVKLEWG